MGISSSKFQSSGALKGAKAPTLPGVVLPPKVDASMKRYCGTVPKDKGGGDTMTFQVHGHKIKVTIPHMYRTPDGMRKIRPGDKFHFEWGLRESVMASTLPTLPGTTVVEAKPMVFANVSHAFYSRQFNDQKEQTKMSQIIGGMMQDAQSMLLQQAAEQGCNAVLSINCNVSTDSSGEDGNSKIVIVTLVGTPCVVMTSSEIPVVEAEATVKPDIMF